ncbi:MAG: hypothetical protein H0W86_06430 [Armatimonadetes bacterium]|nr:hypothetical protein [Armatimonadota bacterium]
MKHAIPFICLALVVGCAQSVAQTSELKAGTKIRTILLRELTSGGSNEGDSVPLLAMEDVKDAEGRVLIAKGAIAYGKVAWSRGATGFTSVAKQPARLAITIETTIASDGQPVELKADKEDKEGRYRLTQDNTSRERASDALSELLEGADSKETLEQIQKMFEGGEIPAFRPNTEDVARRLGLANTLALAQKGGLAAIPGLLRDIGRGSLTHIAGAEAGLLVGAINELANVGGQVGGWIAGRLKGSNIRAYAGTPITVYVAKPVAVKISGG